MKSIGFRVTKGCTDGVSALAISQAEKDCIICA